ncbi:flagellar motor protein MotB [Alkalimarinus sediminis]|uniref:Flagellar motor protein MotB n=1 Tax=Alkalimarinus sediminis TaxID=1632866 RepID=A0A9E8HK13_9ALTE|nr:flagellar motor protein MotB [Alkalimarinus sediminis]UZW74103.1 flagellar motor protein MotB [Alkalimarinus sediminis]
MEDLPPIIVRKVVKKAGHHGGAWKVAFADFATAMMAFFLVLWLSATASPEQKEAIEGYFKDPIGFVEGGSPNPVDLDGSASMVRSSSADQDDSDIQFEDEEIEALADTIEEERLQDLMATLQEKIDQNETLKEFKDQLLLDITPEGLRIQIVDQSKRPMFDSGKSELKFYSEDLLVELGKTISQVPNKISLTGHTDAAPFSGREGYTNWELSADRANAARRAVVAGGVDEDQVSRVVGLASSVLFDQNDSYAAVNRRIAIIVLNRKAEDEITRNAGVRDAETSNKGASKQLESGSWFDDVEEVNPDDVSW